MAKAQGNEVVPCDVAGRGGGWLPGKRKRSWNSTRKRARKKGREAQGGLESMNWGGWIWGRDQRDFPERWGGEGMTETRP